LNNDEDEEDEDVFYETEMLEFYHNKHQKQMEVLNLIAKSEGLNCSELPAVGCSSVEPLGVEAPVQNLETQALYPVLTEYEQHQEKLVQQMRTEQGLTAETDPGYRESWKLVPDEISKRAQKRQHGKQKRPFCRKSFYRKLIQKKN